MGIEERFIEKNPHAEHFVIELRHNTITKHDIAGQTFTDGLELQVKLSKRLHFLNTRFPSRSLDGQPPLVAHPEARHSGRPYRLEWEKAMLDMQRVYDYLAQARWFRRVSSPGQFTLGAQRYGVGKDFTNQTLEITFDAHTRELLCLSEDGRQKIRRPVQGLTKSTLMGELDPLVAQPAYQLALPFSPSTWREMMLANDLTGTTS